MTLAAALLVAAAARLRWPDGRSLVRLRLDRTVGADVTGRAVSGSKVPVGWLLAAAAALGAVVVPVLPVTSGPRIVLAATAAAIAWFAAHQVRGARAAARVALRRADVVELLGLMTAELRAGVLPHRMLAGLADDFAVLGSAARAADVGADVPSALRGAAAVDGYEPLRDVAAAWQVSDRSGAPLAAVVERLEQSARQDREIGREVRSAVAPARATGRLMALLPVVGLLLGSGMGGDPVAVLTSTWIGVACLAAGCLLACAGITWIERIAASAGDPP